MKFGMFSKNPHEICRFHLWQCELDWSLEMNFETEGDSYTSAHGLNSGRMWFLEMTNCQLCMTLFIEYTQEYPDSIASVTAAVQMTDSCTFSLASW